MDEAWNDVTQKFHNQAGDALNPSKYFARNVFPAFKMSAPCDMDKESCSLAK